MNVRDLGGLRAGAGRKTQPGRLVRSNNIRRLTEDGRRALLEHGISRIVDLRFPEEMLEDPPGDAPVEVVHVSVLGPTRTDEWQAEQDAAMERAVDAAAYLRGWYLESLERYRGGFAEAVRAVAGAPGGGVVVHCLGGKDRTGLLVALLLRVAGVEIDAIAADYALTERQLARHNAAWLAKAADPVERRRAQLLGPTPAQAMADVLTELEHRYGSVEEYLRGAGVTAAELDRVRERLLGE